MVHVFICSDCMCMKSSTVATPSNTNFTHTIVKNKTNKIKKGEQFQYHTTQL